jgi:nicotinamidase-related amidase
MNPASAAIILIGFQNDYFAADGILHGVLEDPNGCKQSLQNTLDLLSALQTSGLHFISTPIIFTPTYEELVDPVGILKTIRDVGAFRADSSGSATVSELVQFGNRIVEIPGKRGLNAFSETALDKYLSSHGVKHLILAGAVTSLCIDSTGRSAHERGYRVTILSDCTCGRTVFEQEFYCSQIFPMYANVITSGELARGFSEVHD